MMRSLSGIWAWTGLSPSKRADAEAAEKRKNEIKAAFHRLAKSLEHHRARKGFGPDQFENWKEKYPNEFGTIYEHYKLDDENIPEVIMEYLSNLNKSEPIPDHMTKLAVVNDRADMT